MDLNILIFLSCICLLFIMGRIFIVPIKWILKLVFNSILGGVLIWIINLVGATWGFHIGLNLYTSILVRIIRNTRCDMFGSHKIVINIKKSTYKYYVYFLDACKIIKLNFFIKITICESMTFEFIARLNSMNYVLYLCYIFI